ncbi:transducin/WD40 repeat-like superfamily protein [Actinidia rufa]|uniref:Transducin/WD40 repeat-like superfamily protein n=1 Tax=Actinidia rufa TaxID=165716 RepID=A0A7J0GSM9_9ERIC|nr:transducin/WD40 repeat-like superfamily protein [Actinidia rufa]
MEETAMEDGDNNRDMEVAPALIAVHPTRESIAVAVGSDLRVFDLLSSEKRVSAVAISNDGLFVCFADKFGVVWVVGLGGLHETQALSSKKVVPILALYCSIITSLVRLWDMASGSLLDTCEVGAEAGLVESNGKEGECCSAITDLCAIPSSSLVVVNYPDVGVLCHYRLPEAVLLSCNLSDKTLSISKVISVDGEAFIPTSLGISSSADFYWMVTGVSNLRGSDLTSLARVKVISGFTKINPSGDLETTVLEDDDVLGGMQLLEKLQGSASVKEEVFLGVAETLKIAMRNLLIKKQYSMERRDFRKRAETTEKSNINKISITVTTYPFSYVQY